jgi:hypothetical protein
LIQKEILTRLVGGRYSDPAKFLLDEDGFNGDCLHEHWMMGEMPQSYKNADKASFGERIKGTVANGWMRLRLMRTEPTLLHPFVRLSISLNDEPQALGKFPPLKEGLGDKVCVYHCRASELPLVGTWRDYSDEELAEMGNGSDPGLEAERELRRRIDAEMPAFCHWLLTEWRIPAERLRPDGKGDKPWRFGFRAYHAEVIRDALWEDTTAAQLLRMIDEAEFQDDWEAAPLKLWQLGGKHNHQPNGSRWWGSAEKLQLLLTGEAGLKCSVASLAKQLFARSKAVDLLGVVAINEVYGGPCGRIYKGEETRTRMWRGYWVQCPPGASRDADVTGL